MNTVEKTYKGYQIIKMTNLGYYLIAPEQECDYIQKPFYNITDAEKYIDKIKNEETSNPKMNAFTTGCIGVLCLLAIVTIFATGSYGLGLTIVKLFSTSIGTVGTLMTIMIGFTVSLIIFAILLLTLTFISIGQAIGEELTRKKH